MKETEADFQLFKRFKQNQNRKKIIVLSWQIMVLVSFFLLWELASRMYWIDPFICSSPSQITAFLFGNGSSEFVLIHLRTTLLETAAGIIIGTISGILTARALWTSFRFSTVMNSGLIIMKAMPIWALGPIIIIVLWPDYGAIITIGAVFSAITTSSIVYSAFKAVDDNYIKLLKSFGATRGEIFKEAVFPAALPTVISTLKINILISWIGIIIGEFLVSKGGLGYLISYGTRVNDFTLILASVLLIAVSAAIMYGIVERTEHWLLQKIK
ncbi:ABC transporter permease [Virgibacillus siamensis]|uniref:ABC transporter permease n=1 Tax=Virgibacillus siamensis TaxID=480071 RepID=A0ABN1FDJ9_9BACI